MSSRRNSLTKLAFGNISVPESSWFEEVCEDSVEDVPNVDYIDSRVHGVRAEKSRLSPCLRSASISSAKFSGTRQGGVVPCNDSPRISWFYDDDNTNQEGDNSMIYPPNVMRQNERKSSRNQLYCIDESRPLRPTNDRDIDYLGPDDRITSSLTLTDVSSYSGLEEEDDEVTDNNAYTSWFRGSSYKSHEVAAQSKQRQSDPFYQKLPRAKERTSAISQQQRKLSAQEGYVANFDYGVYSKNANDATSSTSTTTPSRLTYSSNNIHTPRGISRPEPLESHRSGEQEFILPTMIVASNLFVSPLSTPESAFDRPTIGKSLSSSAISTDQVSSRSRKSTSRSFDVDDTSSTGGSVQSYLQYSHCGSDNIDRLIRRSLSDDEWSESSLQLPDFISTTQQDLITQGISPNRTAVNAQTDTVSDDLSKIFILLLSPETKQFELIQICNLCLLENTIGHILDLIPKNSMVPLLGNRPYIGLCRPKDGIEMTAKHVPAGKVPGGWRIVRGEILIAIPPGFSGLQCKTMGGQILLNQKLVKLLRRKDPLAPKKRRSSRSHKSKVAAEIQLSDAGGKSTAGGRRLSRSSPILQVVDENAVINDDEIPSLPLFSSPDSVNQQRHKIEQHNSLTPNPENLSAESEGVSAVDVSKAEEQVRLLQSIANNSFKISSLEDVLEEAIDDDDDESIATEIWNERVRLATERNEALTNLMGIDVLVCDDINDSGDRVIQIKQKNQTVDDAAFKSMCAFLAVLLCRHFFKGVGGGSTPPIGANGLVYCAAIFKSLLHFQRVHNAYHERHNRPLEEVTPGAYQVLPQGDAYGYSSWRKAANL